MMSIKRIIGSVYDHPSLYDVLFSDACRREVEFLLDALSRYSGAKRRSGAAGKASFFEPACGTGRLLWRLGKLGHTVSGLDLNPKAVAFCNKRLRRHGLPESTVLGDMTNFTLHDLGREKPFDLAFNFVSSFLHLTTEAAALDHLEAVAESLKFRGIYLLGLHLLPRGEAHCSRESWSTRHGSLSIRSHLGRIAVDRKKRIETVEFRIEATTPKKRYEVVDTFPLRIYSAPQFFDLLAKSGRFKVLETYDFSLDLPIKVDATTEDVVFVLRKK